MYEPRFRMEYNQYDPSTTARLHSHCSIRVSRRVRWARHDTRCNGAVARKPTPPAPTGHRRCAGGSRHTPGNAPGAASSPGRFFYPALQPDEANVRQDAPGQMMMPPPPRAHFVVAHTQLLLALLEAGCDRPAHAAELDQRGQRGSRRGMAHRGFQVPG